MNVADYAELLSGRHIASLGTESPYGQIHLTAVWYLFHDEQFYVATSSRSRKARNVAERKKASLMVDTRGPGAERGLVAVGNAEIFAGEDSRELNSRIHRKYLSETAMTDHRVGPRFAQLDDVTIRLTPASWYGWDMKVVDEALFGGLMRTPGYLLPLD